MIIKKGHRGDEVKQIQLALGLKSDGIFGEKTEHELHQLSCRFVLQGAFR